MSLQMSRQSGTIVSPSVRDGIKNNTEDHKYGVWSFWYKFSSYDGDFSNIIFYGDQGGQASKGIHFRSNGMDGIGGSGSFPTPFIRCNARRNGSWMSFIISPIQLTIENATSADGYVHLIFGIFPKYSDQPNGPRVFKAFMNGRPWEFTVVFGNNGETTKRSEYDIDTDDFYLEMIHNNDEEIYFRCDQINENNVIHFQDMWYASNSDPTKMLTLDQAKDISAGIDPDTIIPVESRAFRYKMISDGVDAWGNCETMVSPGPEFTFDAIEASSDLVAPSDLAHDNSDIGGQLGNRCVRLSWRGIDNTRGFAYEVQRKLTAEPDINFETVAIIPDVMTTRTAGRKRGFENTTGERLENYFFDFDGVEPGESYSYRVRSLSAGDINQAHHRSDWSNIVDNVQVQAFASPKLESFFNASVPNKVVLPRRRSKLWFWTIRAFNGSQTHNAYRSCGVNDSRTTLEFYDFFRTHLPKEVFDVMNIHWRFTFGCQMFADRAVSDPEGFDMDIENMVGGLNNESQWNLTGALHPFYALRRHGHVITPPALSGVASGLSVFDETLENIFDEMKELSDLGVRQDTYICSPIRYASVYRDGIFSHPMMGKYHLYSRVGHLGDTSLDKRLDESDVAPYLSSESPHKKHLDWLLNSGIEIGGEPIFRRGQMKQLLNSDYPFRVLTSVDRFVNWEGNIGDGQDQYPFFSEVLGREKLGIKSEVDVIFYENVQDWVDHFDYSKGKEPITSANFMDKLIQRLRHSRQTGLEYGVSVGGYARAPDRILEWWENPAVTDAQREEFLDLISLPPDDDGEDDFEIPGPVGSSISPTRPMKIKLGIKAAQRSIPKPFLNNKAIELTQKSKNYFVSASESIINKVSLLTFKFLSPDTKVVYTINGGQPTKSSNVYKDYIRLDESLTDNGIIIIKAMILSKQDSSINGRTIEIRCKLI